MPISHHSLCCNKNKNIYNFLLTSFFCSHSVAQVSHVNIHKVSVLSCRLSANSSFALSPSPFLFSRTLFFSLVFPLSRLSDMNANPNKRQRQPALLGDHPPEYGKARWGTRVNTFASQTGGVIVKTTTNWDAFITVAARWCCFDFKA